jgi:hypothetical protein
MLNELIRRLNGHGSDEASLAAALERLAQEQTAASAALADLHERRREALLDDASDSVLDKLEREIAHAKTRIEKLALAEPSLRERWHTARGVEEARAAEAIVAVYLSQSEDVAAKLAAADIAAVQQRQTWDRHERLLAGLGIEPLGCLLILGNGYGVEWSLRTRKAIAAMRAAREPRTAALPVSPRPPVAARAGARAMPHEQRMTDSQRQVSVALNNGVAARRPAMRPADDLAPLEPGEARVKVLRSGFSPADDRPACAFGQIIRMPRGVAERVEGIVMILERYGEASAAVAAPAAGGTAGEPPPGEAP